MKTLKITSVILLFAFSLSLVSGATAVEQSKLQDFKIPEKELNVKLNHKFKINLKSNPTTGYKWVVYYNHKFLKLVGEKYIPDKPIFDGSGGHTIFIFKALKTGKTDIVLRYTGHTTKELPAKMVVYHVKIHR